MEYFAIDGTWWLPSSPDHQVPGTLSLDADGLTLVVYGSLVPTVEAPGKVLVQEGPPDWATTPFILGRTHDGKKVTLLDAEGANFIGPHVTASTYRVRMSLVGSHISEDGFTQAWCEFDCLYAWAEPPSLTEWTQDPGMFSLRFDSIDLGEGYVRGAHIRLVAGIKGHAGGNSVNVEQQVAFAVDIPSTPSHAILNEWIRPLQDFLILALGRPVRLTNLRLRPTKAALHDDMVRVSFEAIQPAPGPTASWSAIMSYTAPTLLTFADSPISFGDLLPRWFELRSELSEVFVLLHAPYYAPFMFSEHRYSSTFQSAEALAHARGFAGREKPRKEHEKRVDSIVSAARGSGVDENDVQWAERVLQSRNDKPLAQQIHDLVASTGAIGESVLAACPAFGEVAAASRTGVSHPGTPKRIDAVERHGYADVLRWIVRARALMDLGISTEEVERRVLQRAGFQDALGSIRKDEL